MKSWVWIVSLAGALVILMGIEESRIAKLSQRVEQLEGKLAEEEAPSAAPGRARQMGGASSTVASRTEREERSGAGPAGIAEGEDATLGRSLRKMAENPAGRAMMSQGMKAMANMWYADLAEQFDLSEEEEDYFLNLIAGRSADQQQVGMKMMSAATDEEREALIEEMTRMKDDSTQAIKDFLNSDEDFEAYEAYEDRLPERQQLDGLRAAMSAAEAPLSKEQEDLVIDAMYRARKDVPHATDWHGATGLDAIASGEAAERFEQEWERNSKAAAAEVGKVLDATQLEAFRGYQEQMKEMQVMGIKMAEKMFKSDGGGEVGE